MNPFTFLNVLIFFEKSRGLETMGRTMMEFFVAWVSLKGLSFLDLGRRQGSEGFRTNESGLL